MYKMSFITKKLGKIVASTQLFIMIKKKNLNEFWLKMCDIERRLGLVNICDSTVKRIESYYDKKIKYITKQEKKVYKTLCKDYKGVYIIEKLACDIIEGSRTPKGIEFRCQLGHNQRDIKLFEEQSTVSKLMKIFSNKKISLQQKVLGCKIDLYFSEHKLAVEFDEQNHVDYDIDDEIIKKQ